MGNYAELIKFVERLKKIGIVLYLSGNYPWIYIDRINDKKVTEKFQANHGFTLGYYPVKCNGDFKFSDLTEIFKLIKKYK